MSRSVLVALLLAACWLLPIAAHANPIVGTIGFNVDGTITPTSGSLNQAFGITNIVTNNTSDGDWDAFINGVPVTNSMQFGAFPSNGGAFSFTNSGFGTFNGTVQFDSGQVGDPLFLQRQVIVVGIFAPGTTLVSQGFTDLVNGQLSVIIQNIGGGARSSSIVFGTTAVPEPASLALVGLGLTALAGGRALRKQRKTLGKMDA